MNVNHKKMIKFHQKINGSKLHKQFKLINDVVGHFAERWRKHGTSRAYNKLIEADMKRDVFIWNINNKRLE